MAQIGNLGKLIVFKVSSKKVLTFNNMKQTVKGRWTNHQVIGGKPVSEFLGADLRAISLDITLTSSLGVNPRTIIERMENAVERGSYFPLVVGGKQVGKYNWKIISMSEAWDKIVMDGRLVQAKLTLSLEEYV